MPYAILCKEHYEEMDPTGPSGQVCGKETVCYNCPSCGYDKGFYKLDLEKLDQLTFYIKIPENPHKLLKDMLNEKKLPDTRNFDYFTLLKHNEGSIVLR